MSPKERTAIARELGRYLVSESSLYKTGPTERRFIEWFIGARFGDDVKSIITDGPKDGGIDALIYKGDNVFVLQSKYERSCKVGTLSRTNLSAFERVRERLVDDDNESFMKWLATVQPTLVLTYKTLRNKIKNATVTPRFILISTQRSLFKETATVEVQDFFEIVPLWALFKEGFTPPVENMVLNISESLPITADKDKRFRTVVALANTSDFIKLLGDQENERLFAQNVRTDLRTKLNQRIKDTYENEPDTFWLGNNGIYIVCKKMTPLTRKRICLEYPSIINGSQTIHTLASAKKHHKYCQILIRILEMDIHRDSEMLSDVIRRTNEQNPMDPINLSAHEPRQLNIARYLLRYSIFYERREKEWKNEKRDQFPGYVPISIKEVGQWLGAVDWRIGPGKARTRPSVMFQENYETLFGGFDADQDADRYNELRKVVMAGIYTRAFLRKVPLNYRGRARIMTLVIVRMVYECLVRSKTNFRRLDDLIRQREFSGWKISDDAATKLKDLIRAYEKLQKAHQKTHDGVDFTNFFKRDELIKKAYKKVFKTRNKQQLAACLLAP